MANPGLRLSESSWTDWGEQQANGFRPESNFCSVTGPKLRPPAPEMLPPTSGAVFPLLFPGTKGGEMGVHSRQAYLSSLMQTPRGNPSNPTLMPPQPPHQPFRLSGPFLVQPQQPNPSGYLDFHPDPDVPTFEYEDMGRAASLPTQLGRPSPGSPEYPEYRSNPWIKSASATPEPPSDFRHRLLQAMPIGRPGPASMLKRASLPNLPNLELVDAPRSRHKADNGSDAAHRLKNRDAQRRFRQRQRENITGAQKAVDELTKKLQDLTWDVQQERVNARVIMDTLLLEDSHIKRLAALPEVRAAEQAAMLERFQQMVQAVAKAGQNVTEWSVKNWVEWFGTVFVSKLKELVAAQKTDESAAQLVEVIVSIRRENLTKIARFSCWSWIVYAWNAEASRSVPADQFPGLQHWIQVLDSLELCEEQQEQLLKAHARLRQQFRIAETEKAAVVDQLEKCDRASVLAANKLSARVPCHSENALGVQSPTRHPNGETSCGCKEEAESLGPAGPALRALRRFLQGERWVVYNFLFTVLDLTLTKQQEAALESSTYPFKPDWHTMLCALALRKQNKPVTAEAVAGMALPDLSFSFTSPAVEQLMPTVTASELLLRPMTTIGMGIRLPYGIVLSPYHTVDGAGLWRLPPCSHTGNMKIREAVAGSWQIGVGAPLYWFGLSKEDQDPSALEPHEKASLAKKGNRKGAFPKF